MGELEARPKSRHTFPRRFRVVVVGSGSTAPFLFGGAYSDMSEALKTAKLAARQHADAEAFVVEENRRVKLAEFDIAFPELE